MTSPTPQTQPTGSAPVPGQAAEPQKEAEGGATVLKLHTAHPRVPIPYVTPGDVVANARTVASFVPAPRKIAFYGVLGAFALAGALEWPIAVAIGAATEVITREKGERGRHPHAQEQQERERQPDRASATGKATGPAETRSSAQGARK